MNLKRRFMSLLAGAVVCGVGATVLVASPPVVTSPEWLVWYEGLLESRVAAAPRVRPVTYHFSQAGDDSAGDGSLAQPFRTLSKARELLGQHPSGGIALLFRRGDVWREQEGIVTAVPNITIADYGEGAKPLLTTFQLIGQPQQWAPVPGHPNTWQRPEPEIVMWVKEDDDLDWPYSKESAISGVEAVEGSWFWDSASGVLYIHPKHGRGGMATDPRVDGKAYALVRPTGPGVRVAGDGTRVENIRAEGWGITVEPGTQMHGIESLAQSQDRTLFIGCESHYGLSHVMAHYSGYGGIATFIECKAGLTTAEGGGETMFNTYSYVGGNQTIFHRCIATHGVLPSWNRNNARRSGMGFYGHTSGMAPMGLTIAFGNTTRDTRFGCAAPSTFADLPHAATLEQVRCFVVDEVFEGGPTTGPDFQLATRNMARVNGQYLRMRPPPMPTQALAPWPSGGWVINCTVELDGSEQAYDFAMYNALPNHMSTGQFWHCAFYVTVPGMIEFRLDFDLPSQSGTAALRNSIVSIGGGGSFRPNVGTVLANAYEGVGAPGMAGDPAGILLAQRPAMSARPSCISPLNCAAAPFPGGIVLGYDQTWRIQQRDAVGPIESYRCANCDGSTTAPVLNVDDFTCFINRFAEGDPEANCDGSTTPPVLNIDDFTCFITMFAAGCH
jgi:hypothetical protein